MVKVFFMLTWFVVVKTKSDGSMICVSWSMPGLLQHYCLAGSLPEVSGPKTASSRISLREALIKLQHMVIAVQLYEKASSLG